MKRLAAALGICLTMALGCAGLGELGVTEASCCQVEDEVFGRTMWRFASAEACQGEGETWVTSASCERVCCSTLGGGYDEPQYAWEARGNCEPMSVMVREVVDDARCGGG